MFFVLYEQGIMKKSVSTQKNLEIEVCKRRNNEIIGGGGAFAKSTNENKPVQPFFRTDAESPATKFYHGLSSSVGQ